MLDPADIYELREVSAAISDPAMLDQILAEFITLPIREQNGTIDATDVLCGALTKLSGAMFGASMKTEDNIAARNALTAQAATTAPRVTQQPGFIRTPDFINVDKELIMSLEQALAANTAAMEALTAALVATAKLAPSANTDKAAATTKAAAGKAQAGAEKSKDVPAGDFKTVVGPKVQAAVSRVGRDPVIAMLAEKFSAKKASDVPAENWDALGEALDALTAEDPLA